MPLEGLRIGRYHITRLLGSGSMGDVYLAEDARIEQQIAIKVILGEANPYPHAHGAREVARLFQREAKAIAKLAHPHILPLFDYGEEVMNGMTLIYIVMPFSQEGSLADWLYRRNRAELLSPKEVAHIINQAADALQHAHNHQIIHQDVKPSNFLVRSRQETPDSPDVLLADFGIAKLITTTSSASQSVRGTPVYMSPEQCIGIPVPASDQYALAVMAYELLTGQPPFQGGAMQVMYQHLHNQPQPPSTLNVRLPVEIDVVLLHALAKKPEERFASVVDFAQALQRAVQSPDMSTFVKPMNMPREGNIHASPLISKAVKTNAPIHPPMIALTPSLQERSIVIPPRRRKHRSLLVTALVLLIVLLVVFGSIAYAAPGVYISLAKNVFGRSPSAPLTASSATVMITPASVDLKKSYSIPAVIGKPDVSKHQVAAHTLSSTTPQQSKTVDVTGTGTTPATPAKGTLTFDDPATICCYYLSFPAGTTWTGSDGTQVVNDQAVCLDSNSGDTSVNVPAHSVLSGSSYNIAANDINQNVDSYQSTSPCSSATPTPGLTSLTVRLEKVAKCSCRTHIASSNGIRTYSVPLSGNGSWVYNTTAFTGGKDSSTYFVVKQSDIDGAANALETANTPNPQQVLQGKVHTNERFIDTPQCKPNETSDHVAGDAATTVTVTVTYTCTGEVYDQHGALSMAEKLLQDQAKTDLGAGYVGAAKVVTAVTHAQIADKNKGTILVSVTAEGVWVYQFSNAQKQQQAKLIAGKRKQDALVLLLHYRGVSHATIRISGGDGNTLPTNPSRIKFEVQVYRG